MFQFNIGKLKITRIEEFIDKEVDPYFLLPDLPKHIIDENLDEIAPNFYDVKTKSVQIHMQSWLIETHDLKILVDTCGGNHKHRPYFPIFHMRDNPYIENLAKAGVSPDDIDYVFCTHLHIDHTGWNTRLENGVWVPTFKNAKYIFSKEEYEAANPKLRQIKETLETDNIFNENVLPIVESGLAQIISGTHSLIDELTIEPAYGHSDGHSIMRACCSNESGIFSGDALHHPLQIIVPECNSFACHIPDLAKATRFKILEECADNDRLLIPGHFAAPHIGKIRRNKKGFKFLPKTI